ncbi:hypothetical protein PENTCL1PPCAC_13763, partial [Pristionchus entomophagus]
MGKVLGLALPCSSTMRTQLVHVIMPAVDIVHQNHMKRVEDIVRAASTNRGVNLAVDGRYDSPGFCATNCTVTFVDIETNYVLSVVNMEKNERGIDGASCKMEKEGVRRGLDGLIAKQFKINSICTDNDAKISKMMREDFKSIAHYLDFWHIVKLIKKALRELGKLKKCPNINYWRQHLINHAYHVHKMKDRKKGLQYWNSSLAHVTGRHKDFHKVHFIKEIRRCLHEKLPCSRENEIDRHSEEFGLLKDVILKPTFAAGFLRASTKKNTSPCESFNSLINLYAPKRIASTPHVYREKIKLVVLHSNTISAVDQVGLREEKSSYVTRVRGRDTLAVKRKKTPVDHYWRREVWDEVAGVIRERKDVAFLERNNIPDSNRYVAALAEEMEEEEPEKRRDGEEGEDSDVSVELGGGYEEEVDSDSNPHMYPIQPNDGNDSGPGEDDQEKEAEALEMEEEEEPSESEWAKSEEDEEVKTTGRGSKGRGRGRGGRGTTAKRRRVERNSMEREEEEEAEEEEQPKKRRARRQREYLRESGESEEEPVKRTKK